MRRKIQQKYLNTALEFKQAYQYVQFEENGDTIVTGDWNFYNNESYIQLSKGIFSDDTLISFRIINLDLNELKLEEHYTLDDKDAYLEYHFTVIK